MHDAAWILSDDAELRDELGARLEGEIGCGLQRIGEENRLDDKCLAELKSLAPPECVFVDLRQPDQFAALGELSARLRRVGRRPAPLIGLLAQGIPVEFATTADQMLAATAVWPLTGSLKELISRAAGEQWRLEQVWSHGSRELVSPQRVFRTFTPDLFRMFEDIEVAARHEFCVLLVGETGTGKTTMAKMIHDLSPRRDKPFFTVACGALTNELLSSELFGHVKGAFTGADSTKPGKFDVADGGTILLDEIDVLGPDHQAKLLRVLESGEYEPLGSHKTQKSNVRIIVASNLRLEELIETNRFRSDLYYRLNQVKFDIPPLRKRSADAVPLGIEFVQECCRELGLKIQTVHPAFLEVLKQYDWPGNIRELRNEIRRAVLFCRDGVLNSRCLSPPLVEKAAARSCVPTIEPARSGLAKGVAHTEQDIIEQMLKVQNFNRAATARALGISRVTLYNKIRKYGIDADGSGG